MNILLRAFIAFQLQRRFYGWTRSKLLRHQEQRVSKILGFARKNSPYYAKVLAEDSSLENVPVIDKSIMMANFDEINTVGLHRDPLVDFKIRQERAGGLELFNGKYSIGLSSGTSGNRGLTILSKDERGLYGSLIWARSGIPKGIGRIRLLFTLRTNNAAYMEPKSRGLKITFADYTHTAAEIIEIVNQKQINVIAGPPSLLSMIADNVNDIDHQLKTIISYAEVLTSETEAYLNDQFDAPVVQIYQCSEGFIASTCKCGNLHLNEDTILVQEEDIGDPEEKVKNVILTDLYRTTQPIIRYRLGDLLEFDPEPCPCGSCFRRVKVIHGRSDDIFHLKDKRGNIRHLFPDYVRRAINQASGEIIEYQALQHSLNKIEIRLVTEPGSNRQEIERKIMENLLWRADAVGGELGVVQFSDKTPVRNPRSQKLIRVVRRF